MSELTPLSSDELEALAYQCDHDLPPSLSEYRRLIAMARLALPPTVSAPTGEPSARLQDVRRLVRDCDRFTHINDRGGVAHATAHAALDAALVALTLDAERARQAVAILRAFIVTAPMTAIALEHAAAWQRWWDEQKRVMAETEPFTAAPTYPKHLTEEEVAVAKAKRAAAPSVEEPK